MKTTGQVVAQLRAANPGVKITEDLVRSVLRRGEIPAPATFAGRLMWVGSDIAALCAARKLRPAPAKRE